VSDYAPSTAPGSQGAVIASIEEGSPAWEAGLLPGMTVTAVDGMPCRDMIDWYWLTSEQSVTLEGFVPEDLAALEGESEGYEYEAELSREPGEQWGIAFTDCIFDGMRLCRNACTFCFMAMLPKHMRRTLYMKDDDYRLSFLQGNFVTLTNMSDDDIQRVIDMQLSPLHVSVHAVDPAVRRKLMGKNAARGIEALERILEGGVEVHCQIVLLPGVNDGAVLEQSLHWMEQRPRVLSCGIVPLGYTKYQKRFDHSFDVPQQARAVIEQLEPYQQRAREQLGRTRFYLADEFYLNAQLPIPPASYYDDFAQFEDGIGMLRSFIDDWDADLRDFDSDMAGARDAIVLTGEAFAKVFEPKVAASPLGAYLKVIPVKNHFFGGNVNVTGLLCAVDVVDAIETCKREGICSAGTLVLLPPTMFNSSGLSLDGGTIDDIAASAGVQVRLGSVRIDELAKALLPHS